MNRTIDIHIKDMWGENKHFTGLRELLDFLKIEAKFWQDQRESLSDKTRIHPTLNFGNFLNNAVTTISSWTDEQKAGWDDNELQKQVLSQVNRIANTQPETGWLWSGQPFVETFVGLHEKHGREAADAFLRYVTKEQITSMDVTSKFIGVMAGYEFVNQDSELLKRSKGEESSLNRLRTQMSETVNQLTGEFEEFKKQFTGWDKDTRGDWGAFQKNTSEAFAEEEKQRKEVFENFLDISRKKVADAEDDYKNRIRMHPAAIYWKNTARKLGWQGLIFLAFLSVAVIFGLYIFADIFNSWLVGKDTLEAALDFNTIKGILLFGTILAVYGFFLRTISKLTFSSFHLMRDAEEREQLTYLYLALVKEGKLDEKALDKVLQALFSRSETGLLGTESGPTMPTAELFKAVTSQK